MKKTLVFLLLALCVPYLSIAKNVEKEYVKLIKMYDVAPSAKTAPNVGKFWNEVRCKNERVATIFKAMKKNTSLAKSAAKKLQEAKAFSDVYADNLYYVSFVGNRLDYLEENLGNIDDVELYAIDESGEINAFTYPDGRIFFEDAMLTNTDITNEMLLGICAHEYAHYLLFHAFTENYRVAKRERRNNILAGVTSAFMVAAATYAAVNGVSSDNLDKEIADLFESAELDKNRFRYKYSREQEIEADIIAYRFLDFIGIGGDVYIKALEYLDRHTSNSYSDESDHPSPNYRVGLLKYMKAHPEIERIPPKYIFADGKEVKVIKNNGR